MENTDNIRDNEKISAAAQETEVLKDEGATARYGKFKSPDALYASYIELEAEFTKKSQQLKKLKDLCAQNGINCGEREAVKPEKTDNCAESEVKEEKASSRTEEVEQSREEIIREYLESLVKNKIPLMTGGGFNVSAQKQKPKTVSEAGGMALKYFKRGE